MHTHMFHIFRVFFGAAITRRLTNVLLFRAALKILFYFFPSPRTNPRFRPHTKEKGGRGKAAPSSNGVRIFVVQYCPNKDFFLVLVKSYNQSRNLQEIFVVRVF